MSQYFGGSEDRKETPGKQPTAAAKPGLFVAASPGKAFPNPHPAGGQLNLFGDTAASPPGSKAFSTSDAQFSMFGDASTSDTPGGSSDQAANGSVIAESPGGDTKPFPRASDASSGTTDAFSPPTDPFRAPTGAPPHKRPHQGGGRPGAGRQEPRTAHEPAASAHTKASVSAGLQQEQSGLKQELYDLEQVSHAAPAPPSGGAAVLVELLAAQQQRLAALVPELEEGQRRKEELVAKLQAVLQDSQAYEQRLAAQKEQFAARIGRIAGALGHSGRPGLN